MKLKQIINRVALAVLALVVAFSVVFSCFASAASFDPNDIIDDGVFDDSTSMSAGSINNFLNGFPSSCISPNNGFQAPDPTGYSPGGGFTYGANVTAGQVIADASLAYGLNPQVMLATLEKEQSLVSGGAGCSTLQYVGAAGYGCPDGGSEYSYSGVDLYSIHGAETTSVSNTCVNTASKAGFSEQVIHAAWLLKFGEQRSEGNVSWDAQSTNYPQAGDSWNNSDDPQSCYSGPMTPGTYQVCPGGSFTYYDGYTTIDGTSVQMQTGATASLYWYTPHFSGNENFFNIFTNWFGSTFSCDWPSGDAAPPTNAFNSNVVALAGNWTGGSDQGLLYATPNASGGFDVGVMAPGSNGLQWRGTWWSQTNSSIDLENTVFIPVNNSNGYTDLYYATSTNWSKPGFTVGLMANTGSGFAYEGTQWSPGSLSLASTKFIPGNWTSTTQGDFAYATPNASGGFDLGVMDPSPSNGLQWRGTWWSETNSSIDLADTTFIPADSNGSGYTDLYYATSTNWSSPGFSVSLMGNNMSNNSPSLTWWGQQWNNSSLNLNTVKFLPGNWTGGSDQGFAYTTSCGTRGFDLGVMSPGSNGLVWQGTWWSAPTLPYMSTDFIPADVDGDGYTDLYYATPSGGGFNVALQHTNTSGGGFTWEGQQWSPSTIPLNTVLFLP